MPKFLLIIALTLFWVTDDHAETQSKQPSIYDESTSARVFSWVANHLHITPNAKIPRPKVLNSFAIDAAKYAAYCDYCDDKRINFYVTTHNEIWILPTSDEGVLAHEMVHYFQVKYMGADNDDSGTLEEEANRVQDAYRKFLVSVEN